MSNGYCGYDVLLMQRPIVCGRPVQRYRRTGRLSIEERAAETHVERIKRSNAFVSRRTIVRDIIGLLPRIRTCRRRVKLGL